MQDKVEVVMWCALIFALLVTLITVGWFVESYRYDKCMAVHDDWFYCVMDR